jgi:excisionase family DNA binding protein
MSDETLVGSEEASRIIGVPRSTFLRWVQRGRVPHPTKMPGLSGAYLFFRADIEQLAREVQAVADERVS